MIYFLLIQTLFSFAVEIPQDLNSAEQKQILRVVGISSTTKVHSNIYPLGGYKGLEISVGAETMSTDKVAKLGDGAGGTETLTIPSITIGKGLYNNSDLFFHFALPASTRDVTRFGLTYRWSFYQSDYFPLILSTAFHANQIGMGDHLNLTNLGMDILAGINIGNLGFFLGGGWANSSGRFNGGSNGITESGITETQKMESQHLTFGAHYNFEPIFINLGIDRYQEMIYTVRVGFLF